MLVVIIDWGNISSNINQHLLRLVLQTDSYFLISLLRGGVPPEMESEEVQKHLQQQLDSAWAW